MREEEQPVAVANTGPLISAFQCRRFDLIERYFSAIHIPISIMEELERHGVKHLTVALIDVGIIHVHHLTEQEKKQAEELACQIAKSPLARVKDATHHLAEAEAMVLFQRAELEAETLLVDELAAREIANLKAIPIIGFPGILRTACLNDIIDVAQMRSILLECQRKGTRYSNTFIEQLCSSVGGERR